MPNTQERYQARPTARGRRERWSRWPARQRPARRIRVARTSSALHRVPGPEQEPNLQLFNHLFAGARQRQRITVRSPCFVPDGSMLNALRAVVGSSTVDIRSVVLDHEANRMVVDEEFVAHRELRPAAPKASS